jgi:hypothetical protein
MKNRLFLSILFVIACMLLASCSSPSTESKGTEEQADFESTPALTSTAIVVESPDEVLWIKIDYPEDGAVVDASELEIRGSASTGTVISINDDILYVESGEKFSDIIQLDESANLIEIVASDDIGNEIQLFLTVYYEP